jgi:hypothetical protein
MLNDHDEPVIGTLVANEDTLQETWRQLLAVCGQEPEGDVEPGTRVTVDDTFIIEVSSPDTLGGVISAMEDIKS